jgi:hypothetical protein
MIGYASRTGTRRNLDALRGAGWRLLISATGVHRHEGFRYGIDNGAWTAFQAGEDWDTPAYRGRFEALLITHGQDADWIAVPDIVEGGLVSLAVSLRWLEMLREEFPAQTFLIPVQDGMCGEDLDPYLDACTGVFVGGSTSWKEQTAHIWGAVCRKHDAWLHIGRVNSRRRIKLCALAGAHSFDGTSVSRFAKTLPRLDAERRQQSFVFN